ncbi:MAG: diacylglycerol kinase family lipid kinase [Bacteroides sp.]|nr:diacylglycerol kinase family lipid kinase [Roseburia sp.]MCM1346266.1 diacylglycerol kinase family lipid kinase [Bacteroides sp.]MCM1420874.1 diacylglycerol kinase family lipid kinase [Bacteroides sp.]
MADNKRIVFIVNPLSGATGKKLIIKLIETQLDKSKYDYDIVRTNYVGHATEIAESASRHGVDIVCAIGGDGTVNEIARALVHTDTALSIIPCGSGNGLARHLHIPIDPMGAIHTINSAETRLMDYGIIDKHPFFCTCGMGFDALVSMKFAQSGKRGPLTYLENILKNGFQYTPEHYELTMEGCDGGQTTCKAFIISCANASQYGNNAYIAPKASVYDGMMDVTIVEPFNAIDTPQIVFQLFKGTIDQNSFVKTFRCRKIHIKRSESGFIHYDGDPIMSGKDIDIEIIPNGLKCVCPPTEGVKDVAENLQNLIVEHFYSIYSQSEEILQNNFKKNQRIFKINKEIIRKLAKKR